MQNIISTIVKIFSGMTTEVYVSYTHNWLPLGLAILISGVMSAYVNHDKLKEVLVKRTHTSMWASVAIGAFTPLCACGTTAVLLGMLTTALPWGPIMAFLTSSPLTSPDGFVLNAGIIGMEFAIAITLASIFIGFGSGYATHIIEKKSDFLKNQTRFTDPNQAQGCGCSGDQSQTLQTQECGCSETPSITEEILTESCCGSPLVTELACCAGNAGDVSGTSTVLSGCCPPVVERNLTHKVNDFIMNIRWKQMGNTMWNVGVKQVLVFFTIFIAVGYLINYFVPTEFIIALFSSRNLYAVPLAAFIGFPIYVTGESALPLIKALVNGGAGLGSMLAFIITGAGTSGWVVAGLAVFMKKRIIGLYICYILLGGIISGYVFDFVLWLIR